MKKLILSLGVLVVLGACAPSSDNNRSAGGAGGSSGGNGGPTLTPSGAYALKVGTDFLSTPSNEITFKGLRPDSPKKLNLYFKASSSGQFNISKSPGGIGINCERENIEYKTTYQYTLKTPAGTSEVTPRDLAGHIDQLELKSGDELLIGMSVVSNSVCESGILIIHAIFQ